MCVFGRLVTHYVALDAPKPLVVINPLFGELFIETSPPSANLSISGSGDLSDGGSNTIALSNFKYNRTGNSNKVSLTTSETNLTESSAGNLFQTFFDFFIDVPASQAAGSYTTTVTFRGETLL